MKVGNNSRYCELQTIPLEDLIDSSSWNTVPIVACPRTQFELTGYASARLVSIRVRAYGSRGAGPWCESLNARISCPSQDGGFVSRPGAPPNSAPHEPVPGPASGRFFISTANWNDRKGQRDKKVSRLFQANNFSPQQ